MKRYLFILVLCIPGFATIAIAQQVLFTSYTVRDGLVANPIRSIYQDKNGFMWIGTWEGLSRYDGYRFTNYTIASGLSHNLVNDIYEINGKLLVAENNGAIDIIQNGASRPYFKASAAVNHFIISKEGTLIFNTDHDGIYEYKGGVFAKPQQETGGLTLNFLTYLNDSLLIGFKTDFDIYLINNRYQHLKTISLPGMYFNKLLVDSKSRAWLCSSDGLKLITPIQNNGRIHISSPPPPFNLPILTNSVINTMFEDMDGSFWIGTSEGLVHLEASGKFRLYTEMNGLPSKNISAIFRDREGNIWIGTALGLAKYNGTTSIRFIEKDVTSMLLLNNSDLLFTTSGGIFKFNKKEKLVKKVLEIPDNVHPALIQSDPVIFYYTNTVVRLDASATTIIEKESVKDLDIYEISSCTDKSGNIFIAGSGILVITPKRKYIDRSIPFRVTSLAVDGAGHLWAGTWDRGLYRIKYRASGDSLLFSAQNMTYLVNTVFIRSLFGDSSGALWVGTRYDGAYRISTVDNQYKAQRFHLASGLMSNFISAIRQSGSGDIWLGSYLGLDKMVKEGNSYRVFNFSQHTNFFSQIKAVAQGHDGTWYCIANSNLFQFKDPGMEILAPIPTRLLSVVINTGNKDSLVQQNEKPVLDYNNNSIRFAFSALSFSNEKQIQYSYRLRGGGDTTWSQPQNVHEVAYASLAPGQYEFEVRNISWNGKAGLPASFSFSVSAPFWQQWWFIMFCLIAVLLISYALYRYRIRQLLQLQKVRNRIATDLHDDIGSSLTNISILSELSSKSLVEPQKAAPFLQRISDEVQASSQAMDDIIWSVNSRNDSMAETLARMRRYAADLFDNSAINCVLHLDEASKGQKLGMEQRRDVYLIYKESLNNIYKHAAAKNVWVRVKQSRHTIYMQIKDDGNGFNPAVHTHRNGLKNLKTRVEKWKGKINIASAPGHGTNIEITMPVKM